MRLSSLLAGLTGLMFAGALVARTPDQPPADPPVQSAPAPADAGTPPTSETQAPAPDGTEAPPAATEAPSPAPAASPPPAETQAPPAPQEAQAPPPAGTQATPPAQETQAPPPQAAPAPAQPPTGPLPVPPPPPPLTPENTWVLDLSDGGRVRIQLRPDVAPNTVQRIKTLTEQGFYNGLIFHRVIEGFMAQGGDPQGNGTGGSSLPDLPAEINGLPHLRGAVAMARAQDLNSANSQFYIMFTPHLAMDRDYTVFGRVVSGMQFVDAIQRGQPPANPTRIVRASLGSDNVPEMSAEALRAAGGAAPAATAGTIAGLRPASPSGAANTTSVGPVMPEPGVPRQPEPPQQQQRRRPN
jgi:peptidylprolyl isomerase